MARDVSSCNSYNYGDANYWDARYIHEGGSFDWYQRYSSLRPFVRNYIPTSSTILMVGCGNAVMSEDMVKDGYREIINIDISSVAIEMMRRKYEHIPQLKYMQMDARDMSVFLDDSFDSVIDKGTLDSLMCGTDAPISASRMLGEVSRLLRPGGVYMLVTICLLIFVPVYFTLLLWNLVCNIRRKLVFNFPCQITYGDPNVRMPHLNRPVYNWKIELYVIPRPGFEGPTASSLKSCPEPIPLSEKGLLPADFVLDDPDCHFIYVCKKMDEVLGSIPRYPLAEDLL